MNLDLRKVLSLDQWRQLKSGSRTDGGSGSVTGFFFPENAFLQAQRPPPMQLQPGAGPVLALPPLPPPTFG